MTDETQDTKELTTVQEQATPDIPQEGESMSIEDRLSKVEGKVDAHETRLSKVEGMQAGMLTPIQLDAKIALAIEPLTKAQNERVTELKKQTEAHRTETETRDRQVALLQEQIDLLQSQIAAQKRHDAIVVNALTIMLGRDITDPAATQMGVSVFDQIKDVREIADEARESAHKYTVEYSEQRRAVDTILDQINIKFEGVDAMTAEFKGIRAERQAENERRERSRQLRDTVFKVTGELLKRPEFWALFGAGGVSAGAFIMKLLGAF